MGAISQPNYGNFLQSFPEFGTTVNQVQYNNYFNLATLYQRNDGGGPVNLAYQQFWLLQLLTAHIAKLFAANPDGSTPTGTQLVGRISSATEGSVSVTAEMESSPSADWYLQTQYGASYYKATAVYRLMRYKPPTNRKIFNPWKWRL